MIPLVHFCYTILKNGEIGIQEIKHPRKTKENTEVVKIILDNHKEIICTPDHKFMLREGMFKPAEFLKKEYKTITGKQLRLSPEGEVVCFVQNTSRVRTFVMAHKLFKIGGLKGVATLGEGVTDPLAVNYYDFLAISVNSKC